MHKITVKHYLDKRLKADKKPKEGLILKAEDGHLYPLYVQVITKRQNTKFKSSLSGNDIDDVQPEKSKTAKLDDPVVKKLTDEEKSHVTIVIKLLRPFENKGFHLARFSQVFEKACVDTRSLIAEDCRKRLKDIIMISRLKGLGGIIDWELDYTTIMQGLNKLFGLKTQSKLLKGLKSKMLKIDFVLTCYDRYSHLRSIAFHEWIVQGHSAKFESFVNIKMKRLNSYHIDAIPQANKMLENYFLSLLRISTNDDWAIENKSAFNKFIQDTVKSYA